MPQDLTAILLPIPPRGPVPDEILQLLHQTGQPGLWLRLSPLARYGIQQLEVMDQTGMPAVSPQLLAALSQKDRKSIFVHINHAAEQVIMHAFEGGTEVAAYEGKPGQQFEEELQRLVGYSVDELVAADDGTRVGFGQAASRTAAVSRGRVVMVPLGTPTGLGSFSFHDRGHDLTGGLLANAKVGDEDDDEDEEAPDTMRVAFFAYDHDLINHAWNEMPGKDLAKVIASAPQEALGPLFSARDEAVAALANLETAPGKLQKLGTAHLRAFEILALAHAPLFSGGDSASYISDKLLPLMAIGDATAVFDDDEEAEETEELESVLDMMLEVLPCPKPPGGYGQLLESLSDSEVDALAPWAKAGDAYEGVVFRIKPERLVELVQTLDPGRLGFRLDRFCRALYQARFGKQPLKEESQNGNGEEPTDEYLTWRRGIEERSGDDLNRFMTGWAELRVVLESAVMNRMGVGLLTYDG